MIELDYKKNGFLKSKMIWFGNKLPPTKGYHFISCYNFLDDLPFYYPYIKLQERSIIIDLTKDLDKLYGQIYKRRRWNIRRGYKEDIRIDVNIGSKLIFEEFRYLYNKYRVPKGYNPVLLNWLLLPLKNNILVFQGSHQGRILIMETVVHDGNVAKRLDSIRDESIKCFASNYVGGVMMWEMINYLKEYGCQIFDLGGVSDYRLSFGGERVTTYTYKAGVSYLAKILLKGVPIYSFLSIKGYYFHNFINRFFNGSRDCYETSASSRILSQLPRF
jgi:hypothetical protein